MSRPHHNHVQETIISNTMFSKKNVISCNPQRPLDIMHDTFKLKILLYFLEPSVHITVSRTTHNSRKAQEQNPQIEKSRMHIQ